MEELGMTVPIVDEEAKSEQKSAHSTQVYWDFF